MQPIFADAKLMLELIKAAHMTAIETALTVIDAP
jgi:hypothetical protein